MQKHLLRSVARATAPLLGLAVLVSLSMVSLLPASESGAFDGACAKYYAQGNDPDVKSDQGAPESYCACLADFYAKAGLGMDALDFFARTYSDDLTTFIHEYPDGEAWMRQSFTAETMCKKSG